MFGRGLDVLRRKPEATAQPHMHIHLFEDGRQPACATRMSEGAALVSGERIGAQTESGQIVLTR